MKKFPQGKEGVDMESDPSKQDPQGSGDIWKTWGIELMLVLGVHFLKVNCGTLNPRESRQRTVAVTEIGAGHLL